VRSLIPGGPDNLVLITSRRSMAGLDGVAPQRLGVFTAAESFALLARIAGAERVAAEPEAAARIGELCGHLPLAVALVAARLRSRPAWSLADRVTDLYQAGLQGLRTGGRDVSAILALSYNSLPQPVQIAFRLMSLHPGDDLSVGAAAALAGLGSADAQDVMELHLDEHLLQQAVVDRYQFHDLVRLHGRQLASGDSETVRSAALVRLMDHYRQAVSAAIDGRAQTALDRLDEAAAHHRTAHELTRTVGDVYQRAKALEGIAEIHRRRGELEPAAENEELAQRIYLRIGAPEADGSRAR
jgi:hypothetical protein